MSDQKSQVEMMRRLMPRQFVKLTKLCARCGQRVRYDEAQRCLVCPRCKEQY